jgi:hypothetical protein
MSMSLLKEDTHLHFLHLAVGAAYTPIALGPDGRIYAQN